MGTPASFERLAAEQLLSDEWQRFDLVSAQLREKVAPGRALRKYEQDRRLAEKRTQTGTRTKPPLPESEQIASGQRTIAYTVLKSMVKYNAAEEKTEDGVHYIRLKKKYIIREVPAGDLKPVERTPPPEEEDKAEPEPPSADPQEVEELKSEVAFLQAELAGLRKEFDQLRDAHTHLVSGRLVQMEMSLSFLERDKSFTRSKPKPKPKRYENTPKTSNAPKAVDSNSPVTASDSGEPGRNRRRHRNRHSRPA